LALLGGHDKGNDNEVSFELHTADDGRTRLRFWQRHDVELDDDSLRHRQLQLGLRPREPAAPEPTNGSFPRSMIGSVASAKGEPISG